MIQYQKILKSILERGIEKMPVRMVNGEPIPVDGGVKTLCVANLLFSHDMIDGFPLLTTRPMPWCSIRVELEGFIKGITNKGWYRDRNCNFWNDWANPIKVGETVSKTEKKIGRKLTKDEIRVIQMEEDDLGPIYGYSWRNFNLAYDEDDEGGLNGYDQLAEILHTLRKNPNDRRMVCSAWNPVQRSRMALEPCHFSWALCTTGDSLNLAWVQRSCDCLRGVPSNIAFYGLLLLLLCRHANLKPGNLSGLLIDAHLYEDQVDAAKEIIRRKPLTLPSVSIISPQGERSFNLLEWTYKDVVMEDRRCHKEKIRKMGKVVV